jgi:hypothetical protein
LIQTSKSIFLTTAPDIATISQALTISGKSELGVNVSALKITGGSISTVIPLKSTVEVRVEPVQLAIWAVSCDFIFASSLKIEALYQDMPVPFFKNVKMNSINYLSYLPVLQTQRCNVCKDGFVQFTLDPRSCSYASVMFTNLQLRASPTCGGRGCMIYHVPIFQFVGTTKNILYNWRPKERGCFNVTLTYVALFNGKRQSVSSSVRVNVK